MGSRGTYVGSRMTYMGLSGLIRGLSRLIWGLIRLICYISSLSFLAQLEAEILNCPPSGGSDPLRGARGVNRHQSSTWVHVCKLYFNFQLSSWSRTWDTKLPPNWGAATPRGGREGPRGSTVTKIQLGFMYASYVPSLSFLAQSEAEILNCPPMGGSDPPWRGNVSPPLG